jgi:outer membrane protein TolC
MRHHPARPRPRRPGWLAGLAGVLLAAAPALGQAPADGEAAPASIPKPPELTLGQCLAIARERQPRLRGYRESLAAAVVGRQALEQTGGLVAGIVAPDLPVRRKQAADGVLSAQAQLTQAEYDTVHDVIRTYYTVVFARSQKQVTDSLVDRLEFYLELLKNVEESNRKVSPFAKDKLLIAIGLAQVRQSEATQGVDRALAALREAMGLDVCVAFTVPADTLPELKVEVRREAIVDLALGRRGELSQAVLAADAARLEVEAQSKIRGKTGRTFAQGSDIHSRPLPTDVRETEYRPGALGLEMPVSLTGDKGARMERAAALSGRAGAVVDKTRGLIALEAENAYYRYVEAAQRVESTRKAAAAGRSLSQKTRDAASIRGTKEDVFTDAVTNEVFAAQAQGAFNDALFQQVIALAALERITAGGFCAGFPATPTPPPPEPAGPNNTPKNINAKP